MIYYPIWICCRSFRNLEQTRSKASQFQQRPTPGDLFLPNIIVHNLAARLVAWLGWWNVIFPALFQNRPCCKAMRFAKLCWIGGKCISRYWLQICHQQHLSIFRWLPSAVPFHDGYRAVWTSPFRHCYGHGFRTTDQEARKRKLPQVRNIITDTRMEALLVIHEEM